MVLLKVLGLDLGVSGPLVKLPWYDLQNKAFRQLMIIDNTAEYIKFNFQKSSAETIHIVKDREKLEENSCISLRKMTYEPLSWLS